MENYFKGKNVEEELERSKIPIQDLPNNFLWMQVKGGSKMNNLLTHVAGILQDKAATAVVWSGAGVAIPKAISCAEIIKRQFNIQHQVTKLTYKKVEEYWEPKVDGLETLVVKRQIPIIHILLSTDETPDVNQLGPIVGRVCFNIANHMFQQCMFNKKSLTDCDVAAFCFQVSKFPQEKVLGKRTKQQQFQTIEQSKKAIQTEETTNTG